ncbi:MAG: hypothetical protein ABIZ81_10170 [Opitutaceae bacterium]
MRTERYRFVVRVGRNDPSKIDDIELYVHQTDPQEPPKYRQAARKRRARRAVADAAARR